MSCMHTKTTRWAPLAWCAFVLSAAVPLAQAATIESVTRNKFLDEPDLWSSGALPNAGDVALVKHTTIKVPTDVATTTLDYQLSLDPEAVLIVNGSDLAMQSNGTKDEAHLILNGGVITLRRGKSIDLGGNHFILNSGRFEWKNAQDLVIRNGSLQGSGSIDLMEVDGTDKRLVIADTVDTTGFSGAFNLLDGRFQLPAIGPEDATFDLILSGGGVYANVADVAFRSLTIEDDSVANDTYTRAALLAYGNREYSEDWSAYIADGGGSITVTSKSSIPPADGNGVTVDIPEPSAYTLICGLLALTSVVTRRRS
jgi:hypothetical protein